MPDRGLFQAESEIYVALGLVSPRVPACLIWSRNQMESQLLLCTASV